MDSNDNYFSKVFVQKIIMDQEIKDDDESTSTPSGTRPSFRAVATKFKQLLTYFPSTGTPVKSFTSSNLKSSSFDASSSSFHNKIGRIKTSRSIRSTSSTFSFSSPIRVNRPPINTKNLLPGTFLPEEEDDRGPGGGDGTNNLNNKEHGYAWQFSEKLSSIEC